MLFNFLNTSFQFSILYVMYTICIYICKHMYTICFVITLYIHFTQWNLHYKYTKFGTWSVSYLQTSCENLNFKIFESSLFWISSNHHMFQCQECQIQIPIQRSNQVKLYINSFFSQHWELDHKGYLCRARYQCQERSLCPKDLEQKKSKTRLEN